MACYVCGRRLLRAAATVTTDDGQGYAGPTCARKVGLIPWRAPKMTKARRRAIRPTAQMELPA